MNKKKLCTILFSLFFTLGISITEQSLASEYAVEYSERKTGIDSADISQNTDPDLQTMRTDDDDILDDDSVFDEESDDDEIEEKDAEMFDDDDDDFLEEDEYSSVG